MPVARPGHRIVLSLELDLKPNMHVYAPGVEGYIPIDWKLEESPAAKALPFQYPASRKLHLKAIGETVPVYRGRVRITREITFGPENAVRPLVTPTGELTLKGSLRYQACDDRKCYLPETVPLEWRFHFEGLDRERAPASLQRKLPVAPKKRPQKSNGPELGISGPALRELAVGGDSPPGMLSVLNSILAI